MKIANAALLLATLSSASAENSFLRATTTNTLTCLEDCADEAVTSGKKRSSYTKKMYKSSQACAADCLPTRSADTVKCANKCLKKQASGVVKEASKAEEKLHSKCMKGCDEEADDYDKCEKSCDKKFGSGSKKVVKVVQKKAAKITDKTKSCLGGCMSGEYNLDFMMEFMDELDADESEYDYDFKKEEEEEDEDSTSTSTETSEDTTEVTKRSRKGRRSDSICVTDYLEDKKACKDADECVWDYDEKECVDDEDYFDFVAKKKCKKIDEKSDCKKAKDCEWKKKKCVAKEELDFDFVAKKVKCEKIDEKDECKDEKDCDWDKKEKECVVKEDVEVVTAMA